MSFIELIDGTGKSYRAKVNDRNQLLTRSVSQTRESFSTEDGNAYQVTCGKVTLTGDGSSALLYLKNNAEALFQTLRNPTAGTLIDNALVAGKSNSNHGSNNIIDADVYKGIEGDTLTDGTGVPLPIQQQANRSLLPLNRILPKGSSIGWKFTPPSGNTSMDVVIVGHFYYL
jgi:hypothetical protein